MNHEDIIRMAGEAGLMGNPLAYADWYPEALKHFAALVAAAEREACAKVCDELADASNLVYAGTAAMHCAAAIRARSNT